MTKITAFVPALHDQSAGARQADLANQRDNWLRQMELAQLNGMDRARTPLATQQNPNAAPTLSWHVIPQAHDEPTVRHSRMGDTDHVNDDIKQDAHANNNPVQHLDRQALQADTPVQPAGIPALPADANVPPTETYAAPISSRIPHVGTYTQPIDKPALPAGYSARPGKAHAQPIDTPVQTGRVHARALDERVRSSDAPLEPSAPKTTPDLTNSPHVATDARTHDAAGTSGVTAAGAQVAMVQAASALAPAAPAVHRDTAAANAETDSSSVVAATSGAVPGAAMPTSAAVAHSDAPAMTTPIVRDISRPGLPGAPTKAIPREEETQQEEPAHASAPEHEAPLGDKPLWQKRMMHLTGKDQDIRLWIRDNELSQTQSSNLVYRLANDMASMGLRLKSATVNGKPALRAGAEPETDTETTETTETTILNAKEHHVTR